MLSKERLNAIKEGLPKNGFQMVSDKSGVSKDSVKKILNDPERFNPEVIEAALEVVEEYQKKLRNLENRANLLLDNEDE